MGGLAQRPWWSGADTDLPSSMTSCISRWKIGRSAQITIRMCTYINIGFWKDIESFDAAVGKYIQPPERRAPLKGPNKGKKMLALYQHDLEFKIRERIILEKILDRKGALEFPESDLK